MPYFLTAPYHRSGFLFVWYLFYQFGNWNVKRSCDFKERVNFSSFIWTCP